MISDDQFDDLVLAVLKHYGTGANGLYRMASTVRVTRDLVIMAGGKLPEAQGNYKDPDDDKLPGDPGEFPGPFAVVLASLERLYDRGLVHRKSVNEDVEQWRAVGVLDALAHAADEDDDD